MAVLVFDPKLESLIDPNAKHEKIAGGYKFTEGPVWSQREKALYFVDIVFANSAESTIQRWTQDGGAKPFRTQSKNSNGSTYDSKGRLVTCAGESHSIVRTNPDGSTETIAESYNGRPLNSPNDIICAPNGDLIFTDPFFSPRGETPDPPPIPGVYRIAASDGTLTQLTTEVDFPNGVVISNDGRQLFVDDTRHAHVKVFDIAADGSLSKGRIFCEVNANGLPKETADYILAQNAARAPDGMKMDSQGNLYVAGNRNEGIWVFDPSGKALGCIGFDEEPAVFGTGLGGPANLAWGDDDWMTLYATCVTSIYRIRMKVPGQPVNS